MFAGLRIGEFLADFSDIDYMINEIIINKSLNVYTNTVHNSTKKKAVCEVKFHSDLIPYLRIRKDSEYIRYTYQY